MLSFSLHYRSGLGSVHGEALRWQGKLDWGNREGLQSEIIRSSFRKCFIITLVFSGFLSRQYCEVQLHCDYTLYGFMLCSPTHQTSCRHSLCWDSCRRFAKRPKSFKWNYDAGSQGYCFLLCLINGYHQICLPSLLDSNLLEFNFYFSTQLITLFYLHFMW